MAASNMSRRNAAARDRGFNSYAQQRRFSRDVSSREQLANLPPAAQQKRQAALDALAIARREGIALAAAAQRAGVSPETVAWWAGDTVTRTAGSHRVSAGDRLFRPMYVYSGGQSVAVDVRGSRAATKVGQYHAAVQRYLNTGDASRLTKFQGVKVGGVELEADLDVLDELARRGAFDFESIYRMVD